MDRDQLENQLEKKSSKKGRDLKFKHIKKVARKYDLSFSDVYQRARELQKTGDLKIAGNIQDRIQQSGIEIPVSDVVKNIPDLDDFIKDSGADDDKLYKPYNQKKVYKQIEQYGKDNKLFPTRTIEQLTKRLDLTDKAKTTLADYNTKYGSRLSNGELKFDAQGNRYDLSQPVYQQLQMMGANKDKMNQAKDKMKTFEQGGKFKPMNISSTKAGSYKSKGGQLLRSISL